MDKPFLIIQLRPEDETSDNEFAKIKQYGGLGFNNTERLRAEQQGLPAIDLDRYAGIIVGGSPFDISTPQEQKSAEQLDIEAGFHRLFDQVIPRDFPFLGCCSGNGLLGSYCGVPISRRYAEPVSGVDVTITEAGMADPLLQGMPQTIRVMLGHKEACDSVPTDATLLVTGEACPVQMFRLGQNVYATQFHPEADAEGFIVRIHAYKHHGYFAADTADELIARISKEDAPYPREMLRRFVERYSGRGISSLSSSHAR